MHGIEELFATDVKAVTDSEWKNATALAVP
jgi:hypothetical protein